MEQFILSLGFASMITLWLLAGVFLAFSDFIMRSLYRIDDGIGIAAMQSINIWVIKSVFMIGLMTMLPTSLFFVVAAFMGWAPAAFGYGGLMYLVGVVAVSVFGNIPLNEKLAVADASKAETATLWDHYMTRWVWLNHIRVIGCAGAALAFTYGVAPSL